MARQRKSASAGRVVAVAITVIVVIFVIAVSSKIYEIEAPEEAFEAQQGIAFEEFVQTPLAEKDQDNDGLADWEEVLWGTNPEVADTDGDGFSDSEEVSTNNDPLMVRPLERTSSTTNALGVVTETQESLTATDELGREIMGSYLLSLQRQGPELSPAEQEQLVLQALAATRKHYVAATYRVKEAQVTEATAASRKVYIDETRNTFTQMSAGVVSELDSMVQIAQGDRVQGIADLTATLSQYSEHVEILKNMTIPADAVSMHTQLVQAFLQYIHTTEGFALVETDPTRAAVSLKLFASHEAFLRQALESLKVYYDQHDMVLTNSGT